MKRLTHKQTMMHMNEAVQRAKDFYAGVIKEPGMHARSVEALRQRISVLKFAAALVKEQANGAPHGN